MRARRGHQEPKSTWLGRLVRGRRPDRNPLRRGSDRLETVILGVLVATFLVGAPFVMRAVGNWTHAESVRQQQAESQAWRQVSATVLQAAPGASEYASAPGAAQEVNARWTAPDGQVVTGQIYVTGGIAAGKTVMVWVDRAGQLTGSPLDSSQIATRADLNQTLAVAALAVALLVIGCLARWTLDRRRLAAWDADWLATGPRWSPRR